MRRDITDHETYRGYELIEEAGGLFSISLGQFGTRQTMSYEAAKQAIDKHIEEQDNARRTD